MQLNQVKYKSWIEISGKNLLHNYNLFQRVAGREVLVCTVVKANAYGHGLKEVVSILAKRAKFFAVDNASEALEVRKINKIAGILVLGFIERPNLTRLINSKISFSVFDMDILRKVVQLDLKTPARVHLKIETGLNRLGFGKEELSGVIKFLIKYRDKFIFEGVYTHLANIENTEDPSFTEGQLEVFKSSLKLIGKSGLKPKYIHTGATGAALIYPETRFSFVRIGIGLYGLWPSEKNRLLIAKRGMKINLLPVLSWKSVLAQVKEVKKGESVSYGRTWKADRDSKIAVIPVGYSDGYDRGLSNTGRVLIKGHSANVIGRVSMNMFMIDVTDIKGVKAGDPVTLIGESMKKIYHCG